jgi:hypothetical protein
MKRIGKTDKYDLSPFDMGEFIYYEKSKRLEAVIDSSLEDMYLDGLLIDDGDIVQED